MEAAGEISGLKRQVKFQLIPPHCEPDTVGKRGGRIKGKVIERECAYYADFTYFQNGVFVVEDTKGVRTQDYIIKRKLMYHVYGIRITEV